VNNPDGKEVEVAGVADRTCRLRDYRTVLLNERTKNLRQNIE